MQRENEHLELENKMFRQWVTEIEARKHDLLYALRQIVVAETVEQARDIADRVLNPRVPFFELQNKPKDNDY